MTYDENDSAAAEQIALEALVDDPASSMHVERRQNIVQEQDLRPRVDGTRERDAGFLSTAQRQTLLADLSLIASVEQAQVALKSALVDNLNKDRHQPMR